MVVGKGILHFPLQKKFQSSVDLHITSIDFVLSIGYP